MGPLMPFSPWCLVGASSIDSALLHLSSLRGAALISAVHERLLHPRHPAFRDFRYQASSFGSAEADPRAKCAVCRS